MVFVVSVHEILQDGATLPDLDLVTILVRVDEGRDAAVGVDIKEPLLLLLVLKELDDAYLHATALGLTRCPADVMWDHTLYFRPSSSRAMEILRGLGVPSQ